MIPFTVLMTVMASDPALLRGLGHGFDIGNIRSELSQNGNFTRGFRGANNIKDDIRILRADGAHIPLRHAMGTSQVQLDRVTPGLVHRFDELCPGIHIVAGSHDRADNHFLG